ncbi:hypothetical protein CgIS1_10975 [Frankia sp. CgS1]|nr:hypothetical protein BMG523Draft_01668 [Frankia sp. BMG5.23]OHV55263.1 hypothetical protein CgIS1_10975 [Frankia sp. CgIS1]
MSAAPLRYACRRRLADPLGCAVVIAPAVPGGRVAHAVRRPPLLWLMIVMVGVVPWFVEALRLPSEPDRVVLRSVAFTFECLAALLLVGARAGRGYGLGLFRLGPWYLLWTGMSFGLVSLVWHTPQLDTPQIHLDGVLRALALASLALPLWTCGYLLGPGRLVTRAATRFATAAAPGTGTRLRDRSVLWILCGISVAARVLQILLGQYAYLGDASQKVSEASAYAQPLTLLGGLGMSALLIAAVDLARGREDGGGGRRRTFVALLSVEILFAVASGMKGVFATSVWGVLIAFSVARGRLPMRWIVAAAAIFVLVLIPYNASYRAQVRGQSHTMDARSAVSMAPTVLGRTLSGDAPAGEGPGESPLEYLTSRMRGIDSLAIVVQLSPDIVPYRDINELFLAPVLTAVPRAVWPDKPIRATGYEFKQQYLSGNARIYSAAAVSPQADLYLHGGLLPLLVGMALLGAGFRLIDEAWDPMKDLRYIVIFVPLFLQLVNSESSVGDLLAALPIQLAVLFLTARFAYGGARPATKGKNLAYGRQ